MDRPVLEANNDPQPQHIDSEHQVQIGLLNALCDAVEQGDDDGQIQEILDQLVSYSELHFMSEQLLMRMYAYPHYEDHLRDHELMTERLRQIRDRVVQGEQSFALATAHSMKLFLVSHIQSRDHDLTTYLERVRVGSA
jgi:hemerythrin-like metal-binding protein